MGPRIENRASPDPIPEEGAPGWYDWIHEHRRRRFGLERHIVGVGAFNPLPPPTPRPPLLLDNLLGGEVLPLERVEVQGRARPDFIVRTVGGRDLGRITGKWAARVESARLSGFEIEVSVIAAMADFRPEVALLLEITIVVWCRPADWVERPLSYSFKRHDAAPSADGA